MASATSPPTTLPFVGRESELATLRGALTQARSGQGSTWGLRGTGGIGKTRVLRALEQEGVRSGFRVRWGYCLKESLSPFFPFEQIFRRDPTGAPAVGGDRAELRPGATLIFEEERPRRILARAASVPEGRSLLLITRDRPAALRQRHPEIPASAELLWLSRAEGPDSVSPGSIDNLGERIETFLQGHPGGMVAIAGLEYLISQTGFLPVLRLVQVLRDTTEATEGTLLLGLHAATLDDRERSLMEAEGEVLKEPTAPSATGPAFTEAEPPALRLLRYLESLREASRLAPQLILLDDLQWADPQSRTAFQFLARNTRELPVMLVAAYRGEGEAGSDVPGEDTLAEVLDHMGQEGIMRTVPLGGLGRSDAERLLQGLIGAPLATGPNGQAFLGLFDRTEGNPYFLLESLQQLIDQGYLRREGDRAVFALPGREGDGGSEEAGGVPLPPSIRRLVARRLEGLPSSDRKFLEFSCLVGSEFDLAPVANVMGEREEVLTDIARRLSRKQNLLQPGGKEGTFEFSHPLVWEVLREEVPPSTERETSLKLARWFEKERPDDLDTLARLYYAARDREGGVPAIERAVARAMDSRASGPVLRYLAWRRELLTSSPEDLELRASLEVPLVSRLHREGSGVAAQHLAQELSKLPLRPPLLWESLFAQIVVNQDNQSRETLEQMERLVKLLRSQGEAVPPDLLGRVLLAEVAAKIIQAQWEDGVAIAQQVMELPADRLSPDTLIGGRLAKAWCLQQLRRRPEALELLDEVKELLPGAKLADTITRYYNTKGAILFHAGDLKGSLEAMEAAVQSAHGNGNVIFETLYRANKVNILDNLGDYEEALQEAEATLALARKFQFDRGVANIQRMMGAALIDLGRFQEAEGLLKETLAWHAKAGQGLSWAETRQHLALLHARTGNPAQGLAELAELEPTIRLLGPTQIADFLIDRARCRSLVGEFAGARTDLDDALGATDERNSPQFRGRVLLTRSEIERAAGDPERARELAKEGTALLRSLGVRAFRGRTLEAWES